MPKENLLGAYLKDRRAKLNPTDFGFSLTRRRTPGLRREEVAQLANLSTTWYTWLEQGRGGAPSPEVLDRLVSALRLSEVEREHVYLLAVGHPPAMRNQTTEGVSPRIQRVLDALELSPAIVRTGKWDVVAWNHAATVVLGSYGSLPPERRNILRMLFGNPAVQAAQTDWESVARYVVRVFRADSARTGQDVTELVKELSELNPVFKKLWQENDVGAHGEGTKQLKHPVVGMLTLEYSAFGIEGRPELSLLVYSPATQSDKDKIRTLLASNVIPIDGSLVAQGAKV